MPESNPTSAPLPAFVLHIVRTAAILESRADRYSGYLVDVLRPWGWTAALEQWGAEEATHGESLRGWLAEHDPTFDFDDCMHRYSALPYHDAGSGSHYGSHQAELVARCVVEAMAASYYQALAAAAEGHGATVLHALCRRLGADEARHFSLFLRMLQAVRRAEGMRHRETISVIVRRLAALNDEQILYASYVVSGNRGPFDVRREGRRYRAMMLRIWGRRQVRFVGTLVARVLEVPTSRQRMLTWALA